MIDLGVDLVNERPVLRGEAVKIGLVIVDAATCRYTVKVDAIGKF